MMTETRINILKNSTKTAYPIKLVMLMMDSCLIDWQHLPAPKPAKSIWQRNVHHWQKSCQAPSVSPAPSPACRWVEERPAGWPYPVSRRLLEQCLWHWEELLSASTCVLSEVNLWSVTQFWIISSNTNVLPCVLGVKPERTACCWCGAGVQQHWC